MILNIIKWIIVKWFKDCWIDICRWMIKKWDKEYWIDLCERVDFLYIGIYGDLPDAVGKEYGENRGLEKLNDFEYQLMEKEMMDLTVFRTKQFKKCYSLNF